MIWLSFEVRNGHNTISKYLEKKLLKISIEPKIFFKKKKILWKEIRKFEKLYTTTEKIVYKVDT